jgi:hypothetical protein
MNTLAARDLWQLRQLTCSQMQELTQTEDVAYSATGVKLPDLGPRTRLGLSGMRYETRVATEGSASVDVSGEMKITNNVSVETRDIHFTMRMVRDGNKWIYCGSDIVPKGVT